MFALVLPFALAVQSATSPAPAQPMCEGSPATIRISAIKPGQAALFEKAAADHQAWYRSRGQGVQVKRLKMLAKDARPPADVRYDPAMQGTVTIYARGTAPAMPQTDAAWDAYVKQYRDSSDVREEYRVCMVDQ
jgi:hypothetical protein